MNKALIIFMVVQVAVLGYVGVNSFSSTDETGAVEIKISVAIPEFGTEKVAIDPPELPKVKVDPFNFDIPRRRKITQDKSAKVITLNKDLNAIGTIGEAMMENPIFLRGIEKSIRRQFSEFYADFVKEANLSPEEQIELFKMMSSTMQENIKSLMTSMGENMGQMQDLFKGDPAPGLIEGIKENNLAMKDGFIATLGEERFELFEQYHKEKSAAESFTRFKGRLKRSKAPMSEDQENDMRQVFLDQQQSPFDEETYSGNQTKGPANDSEGILDEKQQDVLKNSRKRQNRILLLPF